MQAAAPVQVQPQKVEFFAVRLKATAHQSLLLQEAAPVQVQPQKVDKAGPEAACTASLALTMLLLLKEFLKETYCMSNERIAAFSPDIAEKRKQVGWL